LATEEAALKLQRFDIRWRDTVVRLRRNLPYQAVEGMLRIAEWEAGKKTCVFAMKRMDVNLVALIAPLPRPNIILRRI
jgi:hypothetical protein